MKLTSEEGRLLIRGDLEGWSTIETRIDSVSRWSINSSGVFFHELSGKYYGTYWSEGATEQQDERPFDYSLPNLVELRPEKTEIITYIPVKGDDQ